LFQNINAHFETNWMSVVVDAVLDRLELEGFQVTGNDAAGVALTELFTRLHIDIEADDAHMASLATSQAYMIVWKNDGQTVAIKRPAPLSCVLRGCQRNETLCGSSLSLRWYAE
jgi:hypothetical protein